MYMDALESEVEALGAEVTRLRLMLGRVSQVMDMDMDPNHLYGSAPTGAATHVDPTMPVTSWPRQAADGGGDGQTVPSLAALEQILRAYPAPLLELLTGGRGDANVARRSHKKRKGHHRRHRHRDASTSSSSESSSFSRSSSRSYSGTVSERGEEEQPEQQPSRKVKEHKKRVTPQQDEKGRKSTYHGKQRADVAVPSASPDSTSATHTKKTITAVENAPAPDTRARAATGSRNSEGSPSSPPDMPIAARNQHPKSEKTKAPSGTASAKHRVPSGHQPSLLKSDSSNRNVEQKAVARSGTDIGKNVIDALRKQEREQEITGDDSSVFLPVTTREAAKKGNQIGRAEYGAGEAKERKDSRSGKETVLKSPGEAHGDATDGDMSYVSMSAINQMLRFTSKSPGEGSLQGPAEASAGVPSPERARTGDDRQASTDQTSSSGVVAGEASRSSSAMLHAQAANVESSHPLSPDGSGGYYGGIPTSQDSPSEAKYTLSVLGSLPPTASAVSHQLSRENNRLNASVEGGGASYRDVLSRRSGAGQAKPATSSASKSKMRPPSTEASTTEDNSMLFQLPGVDTTGGPPHPKEAVNDSGDVILGMRKPIPVTGAAAEAGSSTAAATGATETPANSPGKVGVRTPHAKKTVLQRIREQAEDDTSTCSSAALSPDGGALLTTQLPQRAQPASSGELFARNTANDHSKVLPAASPSPGGGRDSSDDTHPVTPASPQNQYSPVERSMSYTGGDLYSLGIYSPQLSPHGTPAQRPTVPSPGASRDLLSAQMQSHHGVFPANALGGSPGASAAYDYDFGLESARPSVQATPAGNASPLSWMRSRSDLPNNSTYRPSVETQNLMAEGGYQF